MDLRTDSGSEGNTQSWVTTTSSITSYEFESGWTSLVARYLQPSLCRECNRKGWSCNYTTLGYPSQRARPIENPILVSRQSRYNWASLRTALTFTQGEQCLSHDRAFARITEIATKEAMYTLLPGLNHYLLESQDWAAKLDIVIRNLMVIRSLQRTRSSQVSPLNAPRNSANLCSPRAWTMSTRLSTWCEF